MPQLPPLLDHPYMTTNEQRIEQGLRPVPPFIERETWDSATQEQRDAHESNPFNHVASFIREPSIAKKLLWPVSVEIE